MDKMDKTSLESAIRDEAESTIRAITRKEAEEIKRLNDAYAVELEDFKNRTEARTDAKIKHESSKAENRTGLDLKKLKLKSVEAFINRTVEEVARGIRDNPHYKRFLLDAIGDAVDRIPTGAEVRLKSEDLAYEQEIRKNIEVEGKTRDITFVEDKTIKWGGCIIIDVPGGRIFDSTIERIYFRKSPEIRREVMKLLVNPPGNVT